MILLKKNRYIFLLLFFVSLFFAKNILANSGGIEIFPHIIEQKVKIRNIINEEIILKNNTDRKVDIYAVVNDILPDKGKQKFTGPTKLDKKTSIARWIKIKRGVIELMPGEEKKVDLKIDIDSTAIPGKQYAEISFPYGPNRKEAESNLGNCAKVSINIEVQAEIVERAKIKIFKPEKNIFLYYPINFILEIENSGNRQIQPVGNIFIYDRKGREAGEIVINKDDFNIFPDKSVKINKQWQINKGFGKYKAKIELEYGSKDKRDLQDTVYFWILPMRVLIIFGSCLLLFIILMCIFLFKKTRYQKNNNSQSKKHIQDNNGVLNLK